MHVTVTRMTDWSTDVYIRDEPYGDQSLCLTRQQATYLLDEDHFPEGTSVALPQPDARASACTVVHFAQSWHFLQSDGRELIIPAAEWSHVREEIRRLT